MQMFLITMYVLCVVSEAERCQQVFSEAKQWTTQIDEKLRQLQHAMSVANWNYVTNLTEHNAQQVACPSLYYTDSFVLNLN